MGTSTKANVSIQFETEAKATAMYKILEKFQENVQKHYTSKIQPDFTGTVATELYNLKQSGTEVECELYSSRTPNLEWQVEYLMHFMKEVGSVAEAHVDIWIETDGVYISTQGDLDDYTPQLKS